MRAFLSYSHSDKEFVESIAKDLGRQYCVFDKYSFKNGDDFLSSIEEGIEKSDVFAIFISTESLSSFYVDFEQETARFELIRKNIRKCLIFIIDSSVEISNLPRWMHRIKIEKTNSPKLISREIRSNIDTLIRRQHNPFFIGRNKDMDAIQGILHPYDGTEPPHILFIYGLPGVGRRSFVKKIAENQLSFQKSHTFELETGDSIEEIAIKSADAVEPYNTPEGLKEIIFDIKSQSENDQIKRIIKNLSSLCLEGTIPIFFDKGGIISEDGKLEVNIDKILNDIYPEKDIYILLVSSRKPALERDSYHSYRLEHLIEKDSKQLISLLASKAHKPISLNVQQINDLCDYVNGFPPAIYLSIKLATDYGIELVLSDKRRLVDFQATTFIKHLEMLALQTNHKLILQVLSAYSHMPLIVLGQVSQLEAEELNDIISTLIDNALVNVDDTSFYCIADPILYAVQRLYGLVNASTHKLIAESLTKYINSLENTDPKLSLCRALFRAMAFVDDQENYLNIFT